MIFRMDGWMYVCGIDWRPHLILGRISTKLGVMGGCRKGMVTASGCHGPVITAVTVG